ncbi:NADH-quinone oxidoreductase subunit J [Helicobacter cetorum]|uniref:NADH-quinone oxidoreductase subunit J n=1 Tax=Helicobacter cetorum (strain ATCC BAA-540 / CCUG 52418 / MIT 99-5656) TaxID=1163745 RepID=I0EQA3_HELCM|nr:NADH-quinone oxidoreductase subunit J [Helicobacter cetorum]AFI05122.1 NADH:ubiquinone oxidoreductase subunit J [Helicobacter cetorum MIT 99-5656]
MFETIAFYFFAILTLSMALVVVTTTNILYAITALSSSMVFISAFFFLLDAEFLGVVQITVYVGAVIVMYAFGMMFFNSAAEVVERKQNPKVLCVLSFGVAILLTLILSAPSIGENLSQQVIGSQTPNIKAIGYALFTNYLIPFEAAALMLLVAMIGGIATGIQKIHGKNNAQFVKESL